MMLNFFLRGVSFWKYIKYHSMHEEELTEDTHLKFNVQAIEVLSTILWWIERQLNRNHRHEN